jgi:hypothetical protein
MEGKSCFYWLLISVVALYSGVDAVQAQTELTGKVVDFATFQPIDNASIYIENSTIGTVSNTDGRFLLTVPEEHRSDTLVISSIGYKSFKTAFSDFESGTDIFLEEDIAALDEVLLIAETRPKTGNDIMLRAIEELLENMPSQPFLQRAFLRHKERNKKEFKWLIESALTVYDPGFDTTARLKINVDEMRKSYDLREVDSLFAYASYLRFLDDDFKISAKKLNRDTIATADLIQAIKWNDHRVNGLETLFFGKLNMIRNADGSSPLLGESILETHQFTLDTVLVEDGRKLYKLAISEGDDFVGLDTKTIFNEGFHPQGWVYIYWDTYAFKRIEYQLVAASQAQRRRSKSLFDTLVNHKLVLTYRDFEGAMYPSYLYYETPKLVQVGDRSSDAPKGTANRDEQFYYTVQEVLFTEVVRDPEKIQEALEQDWSADIFVQRPYNEAFWKTYNVLLESREEEKLIGDLTRRAALFRK